MEKRQFLKIVESELDNIKANATEQEINRLNPSTFEGTRFSNCI